jgi:calcineurin-like phosphoesterase family protein
VSVWFCSDLHFGHKGIERFRKHVSSQEDNEKQIVDCWKQVVTKRDDVYVLGDACFTHESLPEFGLLPGRKFLVRGNHDLLPTEAYFTFFTEVYGLLKYKEFWLSHAPIHPDELRGRINLHGHVHYNNINDPRYFNCCVENIMSLYNRPLILLEEIRHIISSRL